MKKANLSCVRLIATLMIISCHILQGLNLEAAFWVNVGVQIFFVLSGFLYSRKEIKDVRTFYNKQYKKIIIPYITLLVIIIATLVIRKEAIFYNKFTLLGIFLGFQSWTRTFPILSHTWFISYILLCYLITPLLNKVKRFNNTENYFKTITSFIALAIILQLFISFRIININGSYILLYIIGYILGNTNPHKLKKICLICLCITLITLPLRIIVQYYDNVMLIKYIDYFKIGTDNFISYHHGILGITLFLFLSIIFSKIKYNKILFYSDKYSYYIYLVHQIFILYDYSILNLTNSLLINIILIIIATIVSAIILFYLTKSIDKLMTNLMLQIKYFKQKAGKYD